MSQIFSGRLSLPKGQQFSADWAKLSLLVVDYSCQRGSSLVPIGQFESTIIIRPER